MKTVLLIALFLLAGCDKPARSRGDTAAASEDGIAVYFAPQTDCSKLIADMILAAEKSVRVQAYSFRSEAIAKALVQAHKRGVEVLVILDDDKADKKSEKSFLAKKGISTYLDSKHEKAHNKVMLIDDKTIITGSFNFTEEEEAKADNLLVINGKPKLVEAYRKNFEEHLGHSKKIE
jgi:phosphatidylserine/phosphatidylglycerophosphate/cardiolipin synthase-like enzyme